MRHVIDLREPQAARDFRRKPVENAVDEMRTLKMADVRRPLLSVVSPPGRYDEGKMLPIENLLSNESLE